MDLDRHDFQLDELVKRIQDNDNRLIALQVPEGLKMQALEMMDQIESETWRSGVEGHVGVAPRAPCLLAGERRRPPQQVQSTRCEVAADSPTPCRSAGGSGAGPGPGTVSVRTPYSESGQDKAE